MAVGVVLFCCAGCAGPGTLEVGPLAWSESGLLSWQHGETPITAHFKLGGNSNEELALTLSKSESLLRIVRSGNDWSARGPLAGLDWMGPREEAPLALAGWLTLVETLAYIQTAPDGVDAIVSGRVRARWDQTQADIITAETSEQFRVVWQ